MSRKKRASVSSPTNGCILDIEADDGAESGGPGLPALDLSTVSREQCLQILDRQLDLEIFYKHQERTLLKRCIKQSENLLEALSRLIYHESVYSDPASDRTRESAATLFSKKRKLDRTIQYEILPDGSFVKLVCPACKEELFANILGLKNHCRIRHGLELFTREECISKCGIPVDVSEVPSAFFEERQKVLTSDMQLAKLSVADDEAKSRPNTPQLPDLQAEESRFYVHKKIVVGAYVKKLFLADEHTSRDGVLYSYRWKLFVSGPPEDRDIHFFIQAVKFTIVDTGETIEILKPPFVWSRFASEEPLIKIELLFFNNCHAVKEILMGIPFGKAKYHTYSLAFQKEHLCDLDRRVTLHSQESYETTYLPKIGGDHIIKSSTSEEHRPQDDAEAPQKKKKILTPRMQTIDIPLASSENKSLFPALYFFKKEAKNIHPNDLDSIVRVLFPSVFPLWKGDFEPQFQPYYRYSLAESPKAFFEDWSLYKRRSMLLVWAKNMSLGAKLYWKLRSPIPLFQLINWVYSHREQLVSIQPSHLTPKVIEILSSSADMSHLSPASSPAPVKDSWKEIVLSLQGERTFKDNVLYCRYCGRPFPLDQFSSSFLNSHYKRCALKPLRNDLSTLIHPTISNARLNFPPVLWTDPEFRRFWLAPPPERYPLIDIRWIWDSLPRDATRPLHSYGLLNPATFRPLGDIFAKAIVLFLEELLSGSIYQARLYTSDKGQHQERCLTPMHVFRTLFGRHQTGDATGRLQTLFPFKFK